MHWKARKEVDEQLTFHKLTHAWASPRVKVDLLTDAISGNQAVLGTTPQATYPLCKLQLGCLWLKDALDLSPNRSAPIILVILIVFFSVQFSSVQSLSHVWLFASLWTAASQLPSPSPTPRACSNAHPMSQWCHPTISSSVIPFSSCLQSFPALGYFLMSQFFASGGQSIGDSASASVLPMNIQGWFPLGLTGLISLQSKGLSRVFSSTTVQKHQLFGAQLSLWSKPHIHTYVEKL